MPRTLSTCTHGPELDGEPLDGEDDEAKGAASQAVLEELALAGNPSGAPFIVIKGPELRGSASEGSNDLARRHLERVEAFAVAHHDGTKEVIDAVDANDDITSDE